MHQPSSLLALSSLRKLRACTFVQSVFLNKTLSQKYLIKALKPFSFSGHADTGPKPPVTPHPTASCQSRDRELDLSWCQSRQSPEPAQSTRRPQQRRAEASGLRGSHAPGARQPTAGRGLAPACMVAPLLVSTEGVGTLPGSSLSLHNLAGREVRWKHLSPRTEGEGQAGMGVGWWPSSYHTQTAVRKRQSGHRADAQQARGQGPMAHGLGGKRRWKN